MLHLDVVTPPVHIKLRLPSHHWTIYSHWSIPCQAFGAPGLEPGLTRINEVKFLLWDHILQLIYTTNLQYSVNMLDLPFFEITACPTRDSRKKCSC